MSSSSSPSRCLSVMSSSPFFEEDLSTPIATHFSPISFLSCDSEQDSVLMMPETPLFGLRSENADLPVENVSTVPDSVMMVPETPLFGLKSENPDLPVENVSTTQDSDAMVPVDTLVPPMLVSFVPFDVVVAEALWVEFEATPWKPYQWTKEREIAYLKLLGLWVPSVLTLL